MGVRNRMARFARPALLILAFAGLVPCHATTESHPQEVLDLVAAHDALAMKVRPLQKRIETAKFKPEGAPLRARVDTKSANDDPGNRVSERLRHKNRAVTDEDAERLMNRLDALEKHVLAARERISRPEYGAGVRDGKRPLSQAESRQLAALQREMAEIERDVNALTGSQR